MSVSVQTGNFDVAAEVAALVGDRTDAGAVVTFTGRVRNDDGGAPIVAMTLEHYPGMTEAELARVERDAAGRWPLIGIRIVHRYGRLVPGDNIVLVVAASAHREAAFAAASFLMDYLKTQAPFWKRIERADGTVTWVDAKASDEAAAARWSE